MRSLEPPTTSPNRIPLGYAHRDANQLPALHVTIVALIVLLAATGALWCVIHTIYVIQVLSPIHRSIDFPPPVGLPIERAIPLGIVAAGVAIGGSIHLVRVFNRGRKVHGIED
jgi:hypothetical protein